MATDEAEGGEVVVRSAQTERIGLGDFAIAGLIAGLTFILALAWHFPGMSPSLWNEAAVASGVRPAAEVMPGYWRYLGTIIFQVFGFTGGAIVFKLIGQLALAALAVGFYAVCREVLAFVMRARPQFSRRRTLVMRMASMVGAAAFIGSDYVWSIGQSFSGTTIQMLLAVGAVEAYFLFLRKGLLRYAYIGALLLGLLTPESPMGPALLLVFVGLYAFVLKAMPALESPFFNPATIAVGKWHMTFIFVFAALAGLGLNCLTYMSHDGLAAVGGTAGDLPLAYLLGYWTRFWAATDKFGWVLFFGVTIMPLVVSVVRFPAAADEERFLEYSTGIVFLVCGLLAVSQCCALPALWYTSYCHINSPLLLAIGAFLTALTLACAMTILGVDALCRNHQRLAHQLFGVTVGEGDSDFEEDGGLLALSRVRRRKLMRHAVLVIVPLLLCLVILPGRFKSGTREMLEIIDDAVVEIVDEAGDSEFIFTNGNLDPALEMESARRGGKLKCISLIPPGTPLDAYLRTRGIGPDPEDLLSFRHDGGMGLRTWMRDKPEKLAKCSVQMGFDLWKRDGRAIPEIGGYLSRPGVKVPPAERQRAIEGAKAIGERILALRARGGFVGCTDKSIVNAVCSIQWRIARMCMYRAEIFDLAGMVNESIAEATLAKRLNDNNEVYLGLLRTFERANQQLVTRLTPREGLQLALVRADFAMAKYYAQTILAAEPEHSDANFAMGMFYQKQRQLTRAEEYLKRSLIGNPREPAIYNNLAMLQMEMGKLDAAIINVDKALAIIPESAAVQDTKKQILKKIAEKQGGK